MRRLFIFVLMFAPTVAFAADPRVDARNFPGPAWSPYLVGRGHRRPELADVLFRRQTNRRLLLLRDRGRAPSAGSSARRHTDSLDYYKDNPPKIGWETVLVIGTVAGAFIAAMTGGEFTNRWLPPFWIARFGEQSLALHAGLGLLGGILMAFGARFAGGCTSGHGISGTLQLNVGSWISVICFFIGGIAVAYPLYLL